MWQRSGRGFPGKLRLRGLDIRGATATLDVEVPAPGALSAAGKGLRPATVRPLAGGPAAMRLELNRAGIRSLHQREVTGSV